MSPKVNKALAQVKPWRGAKRPPRLGKRHRRQLTEYIETGARAIDVQRFARRGLMKRDSNGLFITWRALAALKRSLA